MRALEAKALMNSRYADADARDHFSEIDDCSRAIFGLTADEADDTPRPEGWDRIERKPLRDQIAAFDAEGWDVTDDKLRIVRMLEISDAWLLAGSARRRRSPADPGRQRGRSGDRDPGGRGEAVSAGPALASSHPR